MLGSRDFKFRVAALVFALLAGAMGGYLLNDRITGAGIVPGKLVLVRPLANGGSVYGFINDSGNATVASVYRYFILANTDDPDQRMALVKAKSPFFVSNAMPDTLRVSGNEIRISSVERVYAFASNDGFYVGEDWHPVSISLIQNTAVPEP